MIRIICTLYALQTDYTHRQHRYIVFRIYIKIIFFLFIYFITIFYSIVIDIVYKQDFDPFGSAITRIFILFSRFCVCIWFWSSLFNRCFWMLIFVSTCVWFRLQILLFSKLCALNCSAFTGNV